jgi:long-chain acyl-CoA synthetase
MTETNAFGIGIYGDDYVSHPTSTGNTTNIVMDVEIRDEQGVALERNEHGEIWMKSPTLIRGYWNRPDDTAATIVTVGCAPVTSVASTTTGTSTWKTA